MTQNEGELWADVVVSEQYGKARLVMVKEHLHRQYVNTRLNIHYEMLLKGKAFHSLM